MRIISQAEYKALGVVTDIPIELSVSYFPVSLRLFTELNGEKTFDSFGTEDVKSILEGTARDLCCQRLSKPVPNHDGTRTYHERFVDEFYYQTLGEMGKRHDNRCYIEYAMFPVDNLVFEKRLKEYKIDPVPGNLYFQCNQQLRSDSYPYHSARGSRLLSEGSYRTPSEIADEKKSARQRRDFDEDDENDKGEWRGAIADIEQLTNSRCVSRRVFNEQFRSGISAEYLLETPLDFSPGFVQETANIFTRRWNKISRTAKRFCELVLGSPLEEAAPKKIERGKNSKRAEESPFPQGISKLKGPDVSWHRCEDPWFVQSVILARLIGGRYWQYALGYLESKIGQRAS